MHAWVAAFAALADVAPGTTPSPTPTPPIDPDLVTPGVWGFVAIAFLALAVIVLIFDMMRRIRRGRYRADVRAQLDAEEETQRQADAAVLASDVDDQDVEPGEGRSG